MKCLFTLRRTVETANVERSIEFLKQACELFELEDKEHYSGETFKTAISLFLKNKKYEIIGLFAIFALTF